MCHPLALPSSSPAVTSLRFQALQDPPHEAGSHPVILQHCSERVCLTPLQLRLLPQCCPIHPQAQPYQSHSGVHTKNAGNPGFLSLAVLEAGQPCPSHFIQQDLNTPPDPQPHQQVYRRDPLCPALGQRAPGSACKHAWNRPLQEVTIRRAEHTAESLLQESGATIRPEVNAYAWVLWSEPLAHMDPSFCGSPGQGGGNAPALNERPLSRLLACKAKNNNKCLSCLSA